MPGTRRERNLDQAVFSAALPASRSAHLLPETPACPLTHCISAVPPSCSGAERMARVFLAGRWPDPAPEWLALAMVLVEYEWMTRY
jgi:hypothetical protein